MDLLRPLDETKRGNKYVLVEVDYLSKRVEGYSLKDMTATTCADVFTREFVCRYGFPLFIQTKGSNLSQRFSKKFVDLWMSVRAEQHLRIRKVIDRQRANKTMLDFLANLVASRKEDCDLCLPIDLGVYRSSLHSVTGERAK